MKKKNNQNSSYQQNYSNQHNNYSQQQYNQNNIDYKKPKKSNGITKKNNNCSHCTPAINELFHKYNRFK